MTPVCPICSCTHSQPALTVGGQTLTLVACPDANMAARHRNLGEELSALRARVESLAKELALITKLMHDHGLALERLDLSARRGRVPLIPTEGTKTDLTP